MSDRPPMVERDVVALAQLWADQFQHMTTLAVVGLMLFGSGSYFVLRLFV